MIFAAIVAGITVCLRVDSTQEMDQQALSIVVPEDVLPTAFKDVIYTGVVDEETFDQMMIERPRQ